MEKIFKNTESIPSLCKFCKLTNNNHSQCLIFKNIYDKLSEENKEDFDELFNINEDMLHGEVSITKKGKGRDIIKKCEKNMRKFTKNMATCKEDLIKLSSKTDNESLKISLINASLVADRVINPVNQALIDISKIKNQI